MFTFFYKNLENFSGLSTNQKERGGITDKNYAIALQQKSARRDEKGGPQADQRGRLFAAGFTIGAIFLCFARLFGKGYFSMLYEFCVSWF